jgi:hypothetical protein
MIINNQILVLSKRKENQESKVDARRHLERDAMDEFYNKKFHGVFLLPLDTEFYNS